MKVYRPEARGKRVSVMLAPGVTHPITDWLHSDGKPKQIEVKFVDGVADIPDNLAEYMLDHKLAARSLLILPTGAQ
jgi:hypothetical protein